jgi:hypothetical protein
VPDAPSALLVARSRLHQKEVARVAFRIPDPTPGAPSLIRPPLERIKCAPLPFDPNLVVRLGADDIRNTRVNPYRVRE